MVSGTQSSAFGYTRFQTPVGPVALTRSIALDYRNQEQKISIGPHCRPDDRSCPPAPAGRKPDRLAPAAAAHAASQCLWHVKGDVKSTDQIGGNLDVRVDRISQPGVNISLVQLPGR
jgi:autotransporter translocation and assembly factor TamB